MPKPIGYSRAAFRPPGDLPPICPQRLQINIMTVSESVYHPRDWTVKPDSPENSILTTYEFTPSVVVKVATPSQALSMPWILRLPTRLCLADSHMAFIISALFLSNIRSSVTSFATSQGIIDVSCARVHCGQRLRQTFPPRVRRPLQLTPDQEQENTTEENMGVTVVSEFGQTSDVVKAFVSGLTDLFVRFSGEEQAPTDTGFGSPKATLTVKELEAGIRRDYAKNYLWTGDIDERLYEENCSFTDPTLSFSGLATYKRNVDSLRGIVNLLVTNSRSELYSCDLRQGDSCVQTRWRMVGELRLPWGPIIDVVGRTRFSYDPERGNLIYSYDEVWEVEPAKALMQLLRRGKR